MSIENTHLIDNITSHVATLRELAAAIGQITGDYSEDHTAEDRCDRAHVISTIIEREAASLHQILERAGLRVIEGGLAHA